MQQFQSDIARDHEIGVSSFNPIVTLIVNPIVTPIVDPIVNFSSRR